MSSWNVIIYVYKKNNNDFFFGPTNALKIGQYKIHGNNKVVNTTKHTLGTDSVDNSPCKIIPGKDS